MMAPYSRSEGMSAYRRSLVDTSDDVTAQSTIPNVVCCLDDLSFLKRVQSLGVGLAVGLSQSPWRLMENQFGSVGLLRRGDRWVVRVFSGSKPWQQNDEGLRPGSMGANNNNKHRASKQCRRSHPSIDLFLLLSAYPLPFK
jgi:hypothetical protein